MPNWKKVIISGSDAVLNSLDVTTHVTASSVQLLNLGNTNEIVLVGTNQELTSSGVLSIDPTNNYVGINQTNPEVTLHMTGEDAQTAQIRMEQYNNSTDAPDIRTRKARGTSAVPLKNNDGDFIYRQNSERYNGSSYTTVGQFAVDSTGSADRFRLTLAVSEDGNTIDATDAQFMIDGNNSGAIKFNDSYYFPTSDGTDGQALTTDGAGNLTFGNPGLADEAEKVTFEVQNGDTGTLAKGTPVHITSMTGGTAIVVAASASVASKMPSHGILNQQLTVGSDGFATILGQVTGVDTSAFSPGDTVYVGPFGGYTNVKPTGSTNLIQNLGVVKKVDASNGTGEIFGSGRTNDVPNLPEGKIWVGDGYTVTSSVVHLDEPNGRLGIGTSSPLAKTHIRASNSGATAVADGTLIIEKGSSPTIQILSANSQTQAIKFGDPQDGDVGRITYAHPTDDMAFFTDGTQKMTISGSGNVGIGTTSPTDKLDIVNTTSTLLGLNYGSNQMRFAVDNRSHIKWTGSSGTLYLSGRGNGLFIGGTSSDASARLHIKGSGTTSATTALLVEDSSGTDLLKVDDSGNTSIPAGTLSINGASNVEELNVLGNMFFDGSATIAAGGVGDSLNLGAAGANISVGGANSNIVMTGGVSGSFSGSFEGDGTNLTGITAEWDGSLNGDAEITGSLIVKTGDLFVSGSTGTNITPAGEVVLGYEDQPVNLNRNKAVLVNSGTGVVATVDSNRFLSAHFDYVIIKATNLRAGTVMACHDTNGNVVFTETATSDLGSTAGVTLDVIESGGNLDLQMTVPSTGWFIKTFVRAI